MLVLQMLDLAVHLCRDATDDSLPRLEHVLQQHPLGQIPAGASSHSCSSHLEWRIA